MTHTYMRQKAIYFPPSDVHIDNVPLFCLPSMIHALDMCAYNTEAQQTIEVTNNVHILVQTG